MLHISSDRGPYMDVAFEGFMHGVHTASFILETSRRASTDPHISVGPPRVQSTWLRKVPDQQVASVGVTLRLLCSHHCQ